MTKQKNEKLDKFESINFFSDKASALKGMEKLTEAYGLLGFENPFVYFTMRNIKFKAVTNKEVETIGVLFNDKKNQIECWFNPLFLDKFEYKMKDGTEGIYEMDPFKDIVPVLIHESYHIALAHIFSIHQTRFLNQKLLNVAQDIWLNEHIIGLREEAKDKPEGLNFFGWNKYLVDELKDRDITKMTSLEIYNVLLTALPPEMVKNMASGGEGGVILYGDEHYSPEPGKEQKYQDFVEDLLRKAGQDYRQAGASANGFMKRRGDSPGDIAMLIDMPMGKSNHWKNSLANFMASCKIAEHISTWKKPSRRYGYAAPHRKKNMRPKIAICVDTSGSVFSEEILQDFANYINFALDYCEQIRLVSIDTQIQYDAVLKKNDMSWVEHFAKGGGGTCLMPAINHILDTGTYDGLIVVTDGYTDELDTRGTRSFAILTKEGTPPPGNILQYDYI